MRFYIVDDDDAIRYMLSDIIEDYDLGEVVGESKNGALISLDLLLVKEVDILIIDLLMPVKDGLQTVHDIAEGFQGKVIMVSQIEDKDMIGRAYSLGVEYYITKPINKLEVVAVIEKVIQRISLQKSIHDIQKLLTVFDSSKFKSKMNPVKTQNNILTTGRHLLIELGIIGENGAKDLLDMLEFLFLYEKEKPMERDFPSLKELYLSIAEKRLGSTYSQEAIKKEVKASEQRVRRAILQALSQLSSLGLADYTNPKFEEYASTFFDFTEVRKKMLELENSIEPTVSQVHINSKKFIKVLYFEAKKRSEL